MRVSIHGSLPHYPGPPPNTDAQIIELINTRFPGEGGSADFFLLLTDFLPGWEIKKIPISRGNMEWAARSVFHEVLKDGGNLFFLIQRRQTPDPAPTGWDRSLLNHLGKVGALLGIAILDYLIFARDGSSYSFDDAGEIPKIEVPNPF